MLLIIQARCNSRRFKKKVLYKIFGVPLIQHVIDRVQRSKNVKQIVVSTSNKKSDEQLVKYLKKKKFKYFRGSLNNVALRLLNTAKKFKSKNFIRISADSPLIDYKIINKAIKLSKKFNKADLITNLNPRTYPKGQSVELIKTSIIHKNINKFNSFDKEHVTPFFYRNKKKFKVINFKNNKIYKLNNFSVDTMKDLKRIKKYFKYKELAK